MRLSWVIAVALVAIGCQKSQPPRATNIAPPIPVAKRDIAPPVAPPIGNGDIGQAQAISQPAVPEATSRYKVLAYQEIKSDQNSEQDPLTNPAKAIEFQDREGKCLGFPTLLGAQVFARMCKDPAGTWNALMAQQLSTSSLDDPDRPAQNSADPERQAMRDEAEAFSARIEVKAGATGAFVERSGDCVSLRFEGPIQDTVLWFYEKALAPAK